MTTLTIATADLARLIKSVEKSAARDDARPVLAGIHATIDGARLTLAAADGFRLSTAHADLDESVNAPLSATLDRAALVAFAKNLKPKLAPLATIEPDAAGWTFAANGTRATVNLIAGDYPAVAQLLPNGEEPTLFCANAKYLSEMLASHGDNMVRVSRAKDAASAPLFIAAQDGTVRHIVMPMVAPTSSEWKRREDAARATEDAPAPAATVTADAPPVVCPDCGSLAYADGQCADCKGIDAPEWYDRRPSADDPEPEPVTPDESAFRSQRAAAERRDAKRAARKAAVVASPEISCPACGGSVAAADRYCGECGLSLTATTQRPSTLAHALASYSERNQKLILSACSHASDVRSFRGWLAAGRVVMKGQKGIRIIAPDAVDDESGRLASIKPVYVFDVTQTQAHVRKDADLTYAAAD